MYSWNPAGPVSTMDAWREAFVELHGASSIASKSAASWSGRLEWERSRTYAMALCGGVHQELDRRTDHIRSDSRGTYELLMPIAGVARIEQGTAAGQLGPGYLGWCDMDRPVSFAHDETFLSIAVIVPGEEIARRGPAAARVPQVLNGLSGLGRVARQVVRTLQEERESLTETTFDAACEQLLDLVCLAADGATDSAPATVRRTVEEDIRRHVRRHAADRDLNVAGIAHALGWSVRYVQEVLKDAGTTSRDLIRDERLRLARRRLVGASWAGQSIAQVAYSCGFGSHASFSTAFRQQYGTTPREVRESRPRPSP